MIDTHAHLDFKSFNNDRDEILARFLNNGGKAIINIGTDEKGNQWGARFAKKYENIFTTVSYHPEEAGKASCRDALQCISTLAENKKVVAIGEIGLDYFWIQNEENIKELKRKQKELFEAQLSLAIKLKKPVVIHCRDAYDNLYEILKLKVKSKPTSLKLRRSGKLKVVIHCYQGDVKWTERFLRLGCWFSFTGNITFVKESHSHPLLRKEREPEVFKVVKMIPLERIMVETDAPFLAPVPHRGKRNEPAYVKYIIEKIAEIKELDFEEVEKQTDKNAIKFFGLSFTDY